MSGPATNVQHFQAFLENFDWPEDRDRRGQERNAITHYVLGALIASVSRDQLDSVITDAVQLVYSDRARRNR